MQTDRYTHFLVTREKQVVCMWSGYRSSLLPCYMPLSEGNATHSLLALSLAPLLVPHFIIARLGVKQVWLLLLHLEILWWRYLLTHTQWRASGATVMVAVDDVQCCTSSAPPSIYSPSSTLEEKECDFGTRLLT